MEMHGEPICETRRLAPGVSATFKPGVEPTTEGVKADLKALGQAIAEGKVRPFKDLDGEDDPLAGDFVPAKATPPEKFYKDDKEG